MIALLLALLLPMSAMAGYDPLPADTPEATNKNFKDIDAEIRRLESIVSSTSSASAQLASTQTFTGANTFTSSVTITGPMVTEISSATIINAFSASQNTFIVAYATVTKTMSSVPFVVCSNISISNASGSSNLAWSVLVDGAFIDSMTATDDGIAMARSISAGSELNLSACRPFPAIAAGSHAFGLTVRTTNGAGVFPPASGSGLRSSYRFWVYELH